MWRCAVHEEKGRNLVWHRVGRGVFPHSGLEGLHQSLSSAICGWVRRRTSEMSKAVVFQETGELRRGKLRAVVGGYGFRQTMRSEEIS